MKSLKLIIFPPKNFTAFSYSEKVGHGIKTLDFLFTNVLQKLYIISVAPLPTKICDLLIPVNHFKFERNFVDSESG